MSSEPKRHRRSMKSSRSSFSSPDAKRLRVYEPRPPELDDLPDELLLNFVLRFLDGSSLNVLACVSHRFNGLCSEDELWRSLMQTEISGVTLSDLPPAETWRAAFKIYTLTLAGLEYTGKYAAEVAPGAQTPDVLVAAGSNHLVLCHGPVEDGSTTVAVFRPDVDKQLLTFAEASAAGQKCVVKKVLALEDVIYVNTKGSEVYELTTDGRVSRLSKDAADMCLWRGLLWISSSGMVSCWSQGHCTSQFGDMMPIVQFKVSRNVLGIKCLDGFRVWESPEAYQLIPTSQAFELDDPVYGVALWGERLVIASNGLCIFRRDQLEHKIPALSSGCTYEQVEVLGDVLIGACNHKLSFFNQRIEKVAELNGAVYSGRTLLFNGLVIWHDCDHVIHAYNQRGQEVATIAAPEKERLRHLLVWNGRLLLGYRSTTGAVHAIASREHLRSSAVRPAAVVSNYDLRSRASVGA
eukprot:TRINITY_DN18710_c0_g1_i1.p1 TRINITY_DN18710_c0_g1~~TRINITY_DN18710_c0_g1_i1.p1  ORF type:complete len:465 (+),score=170.19 TRINITY_DN18710_c0_g1_i1:70-1464(+)